MAPAAIDGVVPSDPAHWLHLYVDLGRWSYSLARQGYDGVLWLAVESSLVWRELVAWVQTASDLELAGVTLGAVLTLWVIVSFVTCCYRTCCQKHIKCARAHWATDPLLSLA